jgi:hypothetical protein
VPPVQGGLQIGGGAGWGPAQVQLGTGSAPPHQKSEVVLIRFPERSNTSTCPFDCCVKITCPFVAPATSISGIVVKLWDIAGPVTFPVKFVGVSAELLVLAPAFISLSLAPSLWIWIGDSGTGCSGWIEDTCGSTGAGAWDAHPGGRSVKITRKGPYAPPEAIAVKVCAHLCNMIVHLAPGYLCGSCYQSKRFLASRRRRRRNPQQ